MNIEITIDSENGIRLYEVEGEILLEDLFKTLSEVYTSDDFDPTLNVLWDLRQANLKGIELSGVVAVRDFVNANFDRPQPLKVALLVDQPDDLIKSLTYQTLLQDGMMVVQVFEIEVLAYDWLAS